MKRHLTALEGSTELAALYRLLGRRTVALARRVGGADPASLHAIADLFGE